MTSSSAQFWYSVPGGSTLSFGVEPRGSGVLAPYDLKINSVKKPSGSNPLDGPISVPVAAGHRYVVTLRVKFTGTQQVSANVYGKVETPGQPPKDYNQELSGASDQVHQVKLIVLT